MSKILDQFGNSAEVPARRPAPGEVGNRPIRARFDTQFTTDENRKHFALAEARCRLTPRRLDGPRLLRMRNRYEFHNNSYYAGMADTIANYVIGTDLSFKCRFPARRR